MILPLAALIIVPFHADPLPPPYNARSGLHHQINKPPDQHKERRRTEEKSHHDLFPYISLILHRHHDLIIRDYYNLLSHL